MLQIGEALFYWGRYYKLGELLQIATQQIQQVMESKQQKHKQRMKYVQS